MDSEVLEGTIRQSIDCFWETIPGVWGHVRGQIRAVAENFEITFEQFHVLRHIRNGVCSVSELAEVKQISRPAISQAVDILVGRGLVTRQQSAGDRRFVTLALTAEGEALLEAIFQQVREWMGLKLAALSAEELESIQLGLRTLKRAFEDAD